MDYLNTHLLSLILFLPTIAALIMLFLPGGETKLLRWFALCRQPDSLRPDPCAVG